MNVFYRLVYSTHFKFALPFLMFIVGGSFGLQEFTSLRYKYRNVDVYNPREEAKNYGIDLKKLEEITLESQYEELQKITKIGQMSGLPDQKTRLHKKQ